MIAALRTRPRADRFENDVRARKSRIGKWIYLGMMAGIALWILNLTIGPMLWLQADGLIGAERVVIATPYESQILDIKVQEGSHVSTGEVLAVIHSPQVADTLAQLSARHAEVQARRGDLAVRGEVAEALLKVAKERVTHADATVARMRGAQNTGLLTNSNWTGALRERFEARQELEALEAEIRIVRDQLGALDDAQEEALNALATLRERYADGVIRAPVDGIAAAAVVKRGYVTQVGDYILDIYTGQPYVLAYLETGTLYTVKEGDRVIVSDGFRETGGAVTRILPVADQLPPEFQKAFKPKARSQVAHVSLDNPIAFPLLSKVSIRDESGPLSFRTAENVAHRAFDGALRWGQDIALPALQRLAEGSGALITGWMTPAEKTP